MSDEFDAQRAADALMAVRSEGNVPAEGRDFSQTDSGNGEYFALTKRDRILFNKDVGEWCYWDGLVWTVDQGKRALHEAKQLVQGWPDTVKTRDAQGNPVIAVNKWKSQSLSLNRLQAMVTMASSEPSIQVRADNFDADPHYLNTPSGIINLRTLDMLPNDKRYYQSRITQVGVAAQRNGAGEILRPGDEGWDEWYGMPRFKEFMEWATCGDRELIAYLKGIFGLALIGEVRENILPFLYGSGSNGKSTLLEVAVELLGIAQRRNYATVLREGFLTAQAVNDNSFEYAALHGVRLAVHPETMEDSKFNEARVKQVTGGDTLKAAYKHRDAFDFKPTHTMLLQGNVKPKVSNGGEGFWRRLREIPFDNYKAEGERDSNLKNTLLVEGPHILRWMAEGSYMYIQTGQLPTPGRVKQHTAEYALEQDIYQTFLEKYCEGGEKTTHKVTAEELYGQFQHWMMDQGEKKIPSSTVFGGQIAFYEKDEKPPKRSVNGYPVTKKRVSGGIVYLGIQLKGKANARLTV